MDPIHNLTVGIKLMKRFYAACALKLMACTCWFDCLQLMCIFKFETTTISSSSTVII